MNQKIKFHYVYADDYSPEYISGISSSLSGNNTLELNFFIERNALPKSETFNLDEKGEISNLPVEVEPKEHNSQINLVRHIKSGVILDLDGAKNLKNLLEQYITSRTR